jgi:hypothetical protein
MRCNVNIDDMNIETLQELNEIICERIDYLRAKQDQEALIRLQLGSQVHFQSKHGATLDRKEAYKEEVFISKAIEIVKYRVLQYWASYVGNHEHRKLSRAQKEEFFYPNNSGNGNESKSRGVIADEGQQ